MNITEEIKKLEDTRSEIVSFVSGLDGKLERKEIPGLEYDLLIQEKLCGKNKEEVLQYIDLEISKLKASKEEEHHTKDKNRKLIMASAAAMLLVIIAIIGIITTNQNTLTGYVIKSTTETTNYERTFDHYTETQLNLTGITSLKISGTLTGEKATVRLRTADTDYLVGEITNSMVALVTREYSLRTDKSIYALGEPAQIIITPESSEISIYITHNNNSNLIENTTYTASEIGEYGVIALITTSTDIVRLETNFTVLEVVPEGTEQIDNTAAQNITETAPQNSETISFENICNETCDLTLTDNPLLIVDVTENSALTIIRIETTQNKENIAPTQTQNIPDINLGMGQETSLNLNNYFTDPDDNTIYYDTNTIPEITTSITENMLTISSETPGTYTMHIYASDENQMVTSNTFKVTISQEEQNQTIIIPGNETTTPVNISNIGSNETIVVPVDLCSNINPNERPAECIIGKEDQYFKDTSMYLDNLDKVDVARITTFGNLVIKGKLIENSTGSPGPRDFRINYFTDYGETEIVTSWIDTVTGDLNLRGRLYEEQFTLLPPSDAFVVQNKKGTNLGYFDKTTGNLYLRGNLIQEKTEEDIVKQ
jgi:hypothetical protein